MFLFQCYHEPVGRVLKTEKAGTLVYTCEVVCEAAS